MNKWLFIVLMVSFILCSVIGAAAMKTLDLRDELIQPPDAVYRTYGYSDETLVLYNIWANQVAVKNYETRIKKLEEQIAKMVNQLAELVAEQNKPVDKDFSYRDMITPPAHICVQNCCVTVTVPIKEKEVITDPNEVE